MKIAIIGGGASGLACAIEAMDTAKKRKINISVTVFEKNDRVGKKILATGNGRCNITNTDCDKKFYISSRDFASFALSKYSARSNISFFEKLGIFTRTDEEGRVDPLSNQAAGVLDSLRFGCERRGVCFVCDKEIQHIEKIKGKYLLNGEYMFDKVVLSCGGMAGVKNFNGYNLLSSLDIPVTETAPSLVRLVTPDKITKQLKGIRAAVVLTLEIQGKTVAKEKGEILFSDNVLSGIASMQLSSYIARHFKKSKSKPLVHVDFVSDFSFDELVSKLKYICSNCAETSCENLLSAFMPKKIGIAILNKCDVNSSKPMSRLTQKELSLIAGISKRFTFEISGTKDYVDAQVTSGGADTSYFNKETMESKNNKGFFCCGEVLDVDGLCGGYNLQWAWSSGRLAGSSIIGDSK